MCSKKSCSTKYCYNRGKLNPNLAFHRFPSNEELCKKWVEWCGSSEIMDVFKSKGSRFLNKNRVICSDHFKSSDYIIWKGVGNKTLLFKDSIPSVLTALPKVLSPHVIQCITNSQSPGTSKIQEKSNTLCHRRLFIDPEPELESPNIINVKPLPTASENNIKKRKCVLFFNELYNFTAVLYYTFIACVYNYMFCFCYSFKLGWTMDNGLC
ncbi:52 kDa repressor of the inhibitor of the protein kinase-like isoform X2 [Myzus persicae]|uniref:52 kDa repressor of the inhibitor of the protein kinase-like isoform X2 n=1 Tax=Myzus persicae TaxID=13164 RepID=UPI000B937B3C|nr:52 kDa repressor of the inhibitor of the protein kinase-like isoform X2 [Myzus persicae]